MPFPVKAIQVDGGAEFEAIFEAECQRRDIKLFVLPPHSPKLNGGVERDQQTHTSILLMHSGMSSDFSYGENWLKIKAALTPPKPKALERTTFTSAFLATLGT
ncbi:hypothetical protein ES703_50271 [subsurface metagenome]